jgi:hypothetical protein
MVILAATGGKHIVGLQRKTVWLTLALNDQPAKRLA